MRRQAFESIRQRFLREQQKSLDELRHVDDPGAAAAELVAESDRPVGSITVDEQETEPATPAA